jgi:WD40 repeat protein
MAHVFASVIFIGELFNRPVVIGKRSMHLNIHGECSNDMKHMDQCVIWLPPIMGITNLKTGVTTPILGNSIRHVAVSNEGIIVCNDEGGSLYVVKITPDVTIESTVMLTPVRKCRKVVINSYGTMTACLSDDQLLVWDISKQHVTAGYTHPILIASGYSTALDICFFDPKKIAVSFPGGKIDMTSFDQKTNFLFDGDILKMISSSDGERVATLEQGSVARPIQIWDSTIAVGYAGSGRANIYDMAYNKLDSIVAYICDDGVVIEHVVNHYATVFKTDSPEFNIALVGKIAYTRTAKNEIKTYSLYFSTQTKSPVTHTKKKRV